MPLDPASETNVVAELGRRLALHRAARELTQAELAEQAGVARSTVQRLEGGESIQLASFVKILRALDRLDALDAVLAEQVRSPLAELRRERERRRRVRHKTGEREAEPHPDPAPWTWGDETEDDAG